MSGSNIWKYLLWTVFTLIVGISHARALDPDEIIVIANKKVPQSVGLATYYMEQRKIPKNNLIILWVTDKESCSREEYRKKVVPVVRRKLQKNFPAGTIRCLVTFYGLPLKIRPPKMGHIEKQKWEALKEKQKILAEAYRAVPKEEKLKKKRAKAKLDKVNASIMKITKSDHRSSFDSELALVLEENYPHKGWIPNPYFQEFKNRNITIAKEKVLMVSRLDGPSVQIVKRIINDSVAVESSGLRGKAYFDARLPNPGQKKIKSAYSAYDLSIHKAAEKIEISGAMPTVVNDTQKLFQDGECPEAALYCGWYSYRKYIDAFDWKKGAVGYHIASSECATLKAKKSRVWCKMMLEDGVAATIGPVGEPYLQAFPVPEIFFSYLIDGHLSLAECYLLSLPYLSWQMVLIGDPLYNPFKSGVMTKEK